MVVRMWMCSVHGIVPSRVVSGDETPRCPECLVPLVAHVYGNEAPKKQQKTRQS